MKIVRRSAGSDVPDVAWRPAQEVWAAIPIAERLKVLERSRHRMAEQVELFAGAISPELARLPADTLVAEFLPLLEACRFLERQAARILAVRRLGRRGLPFWLAGVDAEVQRVPYGKVLVVGPANYPLFLPGVQTLQALAAGNAVVWKPGHGGRAVANLVARALYGAGLPVGLLRVTDESVEAGQAEMERGADKVFFTGSAETGRALGQRLAETATPCVMELSGCDAVVVLASADWKRVLKALAFGLRLNGSCTCMAPRRVFLVGASTERRQEFSRQLINELDEIEGVRLTEATKRRLVEMMGEASETGAVVHGEVADKQRPVVVANASSLMRITCADLFAPLLSVMNASDETQVLEAIAECPYALTASVFGEERAARALAGRISAGTVMVNDLIVPAADPRVPFGGRRQSGFGVTRGTEGLLEMTAVKVVSVRRGHSTRHLEPTSEDHERLFRGLIYASHAASWSKRWLGVKQLVAAGRDLKRKG